ncbi:MAG TPA: hypothetical protein VMM78_09980 [Thermomicrobiales bacterium]|nr:hypothetical protein [Thermomicrobiales bacterium]
MTTKSRVPVPGGARTPEELETLLEDALVVRDRGSVIDLFEDGAVLIAGDSPPARGGEEIASVALDTWDGEHAYLADPRSVVQARDIALVVTDYGVNVAQRGRDGTWRFAIVQLLCDGGAGKSRRTEWRKA